MCRGGARDRKSQALRMKWPYGIWPVSSKGWRHFIAKLPAFLAEPLSVGDRIRLLSACIRNGGARSGALALAAELLGRVRAGQIESIACFSAKDFALAKLLAKEAGAPCLELLSRQTKYFGEFGFELLAVVPYAYWLYRQGRLERTIGGVDTRCLYYFSENHEERPVKRHYYRSRSIRSVSEAGPDTTCRPSQAFSTRGGGFPPLTGKPFGTSASDGTERSALCLTRFLTSISPAKPKLLPTNFIGVEATLAVDRDAKRAATR